MRRVLAEYVIEIAIVLLGSIVALFEAMFASGNIALIVAFLASLLSLAVVAVRQEIKTQVRDTIEDQVLLRSIPDSRWRGEAQLQLEEIRLRYSSWTTGTRRVDRSGSLNYEAEILKTATVSVRAIHLAEDLESISMWIDPQKKFRALVEVYRRLPQSVHCRRILVLGEDDGGVSVTQDGRRVIQDAQALEFCDLQARPRPEGLGCLLRIMWIPKDNRAIGDLLIVDERETCSIESYGHGQFSDLEACVSPALIHKQVLLFEDLWTTAIPIELCRPSPS